MKIDRYETCKYCKEDIYFSGIKEHQKNCYLNPVNTRLCPVCEEPIKNYRHSETCGYACSNTKFRSGENNANWKDGNQISYRKICFSEHKKECIVCGENKVIDVHHLDEDKTNNKVNNLIPLCPTHHRYIHSKYKYLIEDKVNEYVMDLYIENVV